LLTHLFFTHSYYIALCAELEWEINGGFHSTMIEKNTKDLEEIENKLIDAKENHGLSIPILLLT